MGVSLIIRHSKYWSTHIVWSVPHTEYLSTHGARSVLDIVICNRKDLIV